MVRGWSGQGQYKWPVTASQREKDEGAHSATVFPGRLWAFVISPSRRLDGRRARSDAFCLQTQDRHCRRLRCKCLGQLQETKCQQGHDAEEEHA